MRTTPSIRRRFSALAAAAIASLLFAAAVSGTARAQPDAQTEVLISKLEENARIHQRLADQSKSLYDAGRISMRELINTQIGLCEAELMVATVREDPKATTNLLDEVVTLRERIVAGLGPDETPEAVASANMELAQARVRQWEAAHDDDD